MLYARWPTPFLSAPSIPVVSSALLSAPERAASRSASRAADHRRSISATPGTLSFRPPLGLGEYDMVSLKLTLRLLERRDGDWSSGVVPNAGFEDWWLLLSSTSCCSRWRRGMFFAVEAEEEDDDEEDEEAGRRCDSGPAAAEDEEMIVPSSLGASFQNGAIFRHRTRSWPHYFPSAP